MIEDRDEDLFGNNSEVASDSEDDENKEKDVNASNYNRESDNDEKDLFIDNDFFNDTIEEYRKSSAFPLVKCPNDKILGEYDRGFKKRSESEQPNYYQFKFFTEKLISLENSEFNRDSIEVSDSNLNAGYILNNYSISYSLKFDYLLNKYDNFSKKHHRERLFKIMNEIDWDNEYKIRIIKKKINPYEYIFEEYFNMKSSYKLANLNYCFKSNLFSIDYISGFTPIMIIGDDGGYSDYIMWHAHNNNFTVKIFAVPERTNKIYKAKFRKEIEEAKDSLMNIVSLQKGSDIDEIENFTSNNIQELVNEVMENTDGLGVSLFLARKFIKFKKEFSQEIKCKKFLLLNTIIGLSVLSKGGNLVIKIYDMYTHFTVSVLFLLYNYFEKFTIIKSFALSPHSASRYVVCQKLTESKPKILEYLIELYDQYVESLTMGKDIDFVYPISKIIKDENFTNYIMEMNSLIAEQRIESLEALRKSFEGVHVPEFDKMDIKKNCLDLWKIPVLHYDPRQVLADKNNYNVSVTNRGRDSRGGTKQTKLSSIQDKDTICFYSSYDVYNDSLKSMIDMFGNGKKQTESHDHSYRGSRKIEDDNDDLDKHLPLDEAKLNASKKKVSSTNKIDQLMHKIISDRKTESYLQSSNVAGANSTSESTEELLRRKREMLMSSFTASKSTSKNKKSHEERKKTTIRPSSNKIKISLPSEDEIKEISKSNEESYRSAKDLLKRKEQAVQESIRNRQLAETKKVVLDDKLRMELEKYKKR